MIMRTDTTGWELSTDRLTIRVARPGFQYNRTRFDWTGFVTDVILDNQHTFCSVESPHPLEGAGGIGLCSEFGIQEPVGYDDAEAGDCFPKFGIGLLKKNSLEPYFFMNDYALEPFPITSSPLPDGLRWDISPLPARGYSAHITKTLTINENQLCVSVHMRNCGTLPIQTTEYNHNFVLLNGYSVDSDYRLSFSEPLTFVGKGDTPRFEGGIITWPDDSQGQYALCDEVPDTGKLTWTLSHEKLNVSCSETLDSTPARVACWSMNHVISPEMFKTISLAPGETDNWTRTWTFDSRVFSE